MAKDLEIVRLMDIYGGMLTEKQLDYLNLYYEEDLSLSEIAANEGITRQGVRDAIKRAATQLAEYEQHMRLLAKQEERERALQKILDSVSKINSLGYSGEIKNASAKIERIARSLLLTA
ncbi:MAG: DNA-binding protein [Clostridium sp.]|nr:DNA-binding protein [Clostridium sp.]